MTQAPPYAITPHMLIRVKRLLSVLEETMSQQEIQDALGSRDRKSLRERYLLPALQSGIIEMTQPDTPSARNQRHRITARRREVR